MTNDKGEFGLEAMGSAQEAQPKTESIKGNTTNSQLYFWLVSFSYNGIDPYYDTIEVNSRKPNLSNSEFVDKVLQSFPLYMSQRHHIRIEKTIKVNKND